MVCNFGRWTGAGGKVVIRKIPRDIEITECLFDGNACSIFTLYRRVMGREMTHSYAYFPMQDKQHRYPHTGYLCCSKSQLD